MPVRIWLCAVLGLCGCRFGGSDSARLPDGFSSPPATQTDGGGGAVQDTADASADGGLDATVEAASVTDAGESAASTPCVDTDSDPNHCGACDFVCPGGAGCTDGLCNAPVGCTTAHFEGHAYYLCTEETTWEEARARCQVSGTDLALVQSAAENSWLASQLAQPSWLGLNDRATEGQWNWVSPGGGESGEAVAFANWQPGGPDNCGLVVGGIFGEQDCGRMSPDGIWNDSDCDGGCTEGGFGYVCEGY